MCPQLFHGGHSPAPFSYVPCIGGSIYRGFRGVATPRWNPLFSFFSLFNFNSTVHPTPIHSPLECQPPTRWRRAIDPPLLYGIPIHVCSCICWDLQCMDRRWLNLSIHDGWSSLWAQSRFLFSHADRTTMGSTGADPGFRRGSYRNFG